ncbi:MAG TPA: hypothetical protein VLQ48_15005 [Chloroflexia bacterium]|nr:hypothetical protein [Chloroflexia bacterium]
MSSADRQAQDDFIAASQQVIAGSSVESVLAQQQERQDELAEMICVVEALKEMPSPRLAPEALARIEKRTQLAAQSRLPGSAHAARSRRLTLLRPGSDTGSGGTNEGHATLTPIYLKTIFRTKAMAVVAVAALMVFAIATLTMGGLAFQHGTPGGAQQLESYSGIITKIDAGKWLLDDDTEMVIDNLTEIHGQPEVGAKMTCIAEPLEGNERYRALEVWILSTPNAPTVFPPQSHTSF